MSPLVVALITFFLLMAFGMPIAYTTCIASVAYCVATGKLIFLNDHC